MKSSTKLEVSMRLRKDDLVEVIAGRDKGKSGKVLRTDAKNGRVVVEKVNLVKRHLKPTQQNPQGGVVEKELSLDMSNVQLFCPKCNRGVRFGVKVVEGKVTKKVRICKRCDSQIDAA
jgi:large subunit ribosomal protein L24